MGPKLNLKECIDDGKLDLSLSQLTEVPSEIVVSCPKSVFTVDLSNNMLATLPLGMSTALSFIQKLDLSKNKLTKLPENFGSMHNLKTLDLYHNQLTYLPLSMANLKKLRWLDVSSNPLSPSLLQIVGSCLTVKECQEAARNIVELFTLLQQQATREVKERREIKNQVKLLNKTKEEQKLKEKKKMIADQYSDGLNADSRIAEDLGLKVKTEKLVKQQSVWKKLIFNTFSFLLVVMCGIVYYAFCNYDMENFPRLVDNT